MAILSSGIYQDYVHSFRDNSLYPFINAEFAMSNISTNGNIGISNNAGVNFTSYDFTSKIGGASRLIVSFDFEDENVAIVSRLASPATPKLHVSSDYGLTFIDVTANLPSYNSSFQFSDVVYKSGRLFVQYYNSANGESWCYSDDNGASFTNMLTWVALPSFGVFPTSTSGATAYINDALGNLIGRVNGTTWVTTIDPTGSGINDVTQNRGCLSNPPGSTTVIYGGYRYPTNNDLYVSKSSDAGASYATQKTIVGTFTSSPIIGAASATKVFMEYDSVLYVSTDSGVNFSASAFSGDVMAIMFNSSTNGILGINGTGDSYYTTDGGTSWSASTVSGPTVSPEIIRRNIK